MKKLMIAAAVAAMTAGVNAGLCDDDVAEESCAVYDVKVSVKTLAPKVVKIKAGKGSACDDGTDAVDCTYLEKTTKSFAGLIWRCWTYCPAEIKEGAHFILWETKRKLAVTSQLAWNGTEFEADETNFEILDRYGKKAKGVEAFWEIPLAGYILDGTAYETKEPNIAGAYGGTLYVAGFGTYNAKKGTLSVSGNAVAKWQPECGGVDFNFCDDFDSICEVLEDTSLVAASGTWSVKYSASKSKGKKGLRSLVPVNAQER